MFVETLHEPTQVGQALFPDLDHFLGEDTVDYKRKKSGGSTSINAPIEEFQGNNFVVGIAFMETTFEVNKPPYEENGQWKMVVDGVELTRVF